MLYIHTTYSQIKDTSYIYLNDKSIPEGYYFKVYSSPFAPEAKYKFGLPDSSIVTVKTIDINGNLIQTDSIKLAGGNYIYDWTHVFADNENFKSGIYFIILNAEIDNVKQINLDMKFTGQTKIVVVK